MTKHHLTRSRHQTTFYFRRRVPHDLRDLFATSMVTESLGTTHRPTAIIRARLRAALTDALFERLRAMPPIDRNKIRPLTIETAFYENGQLQAFNIDAKPDEKDLTGTILGGLSTLIREAQQPRQLPKTFIDHSPLRPQAAKTILQTFEDYKAEKIKGGYWKDGEDTARYDHLPHIRALVETIGDKPISDVTADDIATFQSKVFTSDTGGSPSTRKQRLLRACALFRWAAEKAIIANNFSGLFRYPGKVTHKTYVQLDETDLKALFESDEYKHGGFSYASEYWLPLLGLFTGARLNELCQLTCGDFSEHSGVPTISLLDDNTASHKRLKTTSSRRIIPLHSKLIELGIIDYVRSVKSGRIFPELPESSARANDFSKEAGRRFTEYRRRCGVGTISESAEGDSISRSEKAFHSFRSTLISKLRLANIHDGHRNRLAGHEIPGTQDSVYTGGDVALMFDFPTLQAELECVKYDVDFQPFSKQKMKVRRAPNRQQ